MTDLVEAKSLTEERIDLIKRVYAKGATDDEFAIFIDVCKRTGLSPEQRQIYLVKRWNKKENRNDMSVQTGIDGYRLCAERTGKYAGNDDPIYDDEACPKKATVTVWKLVGGVRCAFTASARWDQYFPGDQQGFMWKKMPHLMLGKCAEALALRKAFPAELSGIYTKEEMEQAGPTVDAEVVVEQTPPKQIAPITPHHDTNSGPIFLIPFGRLKNKNLYDTAPQAIKDMLGWMDTNDVSHKFPEFVAKARSYVQEG